MENKIEMTNIRELTMLNVLILCKHIIKTAGGAGYTIPESLTEDSYALSSYIGAAIEKEINKRTMDLVRKNDED